MTETAQERFDREYISSSEICETLGVSRVDLMTARLKGVLPDAIAVNGKHLFIWEREKVKPHLEVWSKCKRRSSV